MKFYLEKKEYDFDPVAEEIGLAIGYLGEVIAGRGDRFQCYEYAIKNIAEMILELKIILGDKIGYVDGLIGCLESHAKEINQLWKIEEEGEIEDVANTVKP